MREDQSDVPDQAPVKNLRETELLLHLIHAVLLLEVQALLSKHSPQVLGRWQHPRNQILRVISLFQRWPRGFNLTYFLLPIASSHLATLALEAGRVDGAIGDIGSDGPVTEGWGCIAMVGEEVEEVRREFGTLNADVPAKGEAVVDVGREDKWVVTAELHAWNIIIWQLTQLRLYPASIISGYAHSQPFSTPFLQTSFLFAFR